MKAVWKYPLPEVVNHIEMPKDAQVLTIHEQRGDACLWALVNPTHEKETRLFCVLGTGSEFEEHDTMDYLGTFHLANGNMVFHVFEMSME